VFEMFILLRLKKRQIYLHMIIHHAGNTCRGWRLKHGLVAGPYYTLLYYIEVKLGLSRLRNGNI